MIKKLINPNIFLLLALLYGLIALPPADARRLRDVFIEVVITNKSHYTELNALLAYIKEGKRVHWRHIAPEVQNGLLEKVAEELGVEAGALGYEDLTKHFEFLNGHTLWGLAHFYNVLLNEARSDYNSLTEEYRSKVTQEELEGLGVMEFVRRLLGTTVQSEKKGDADIVPGEVDGGTVVTATTEGKLLYADVTELIDKIIAKSGRIDLNKVPLELQRELLEWAAEDLGCEINNLEAIFDAEEVDLLLGTPMTWFFLYYDKLLTQAQKDYRALPVSYQIRVSQQEIASLDTLEFIGKVLEIPYQNKEPGIPENIPEIKTHRYSKEEKVWIENYSGIRLLAWDDIYRYNPGQIAFYVRELAVCVARESGGGFKDLRSLLNSRHFRETYVPCLGRPLIAMLNFFESTYAILSYLQERGLLDTVTEEVRKRLG